MTYNLNRGLFLENGPTLLAERDRQLRAAGHAYLLLGTPPRPATAPERDQLSKAA